jgi:pyruvate,orthophosphate dikinase
MPHLLCNLSVSGVFIPDDRLFQREITAFLNSSALRSDYLPGHMLLRKLPVFHSEVGASGRIRELTTRIDSWGNDTVVYFLRKQVHVNASNLNIALTERIIRAWTFNSAELLEGTVPAEVFNTIDVERLGEYSAVLRPMFESLGAVRDGDIDFKRVLSLREEEIEGRLQKVEASEEVCSKIRMICRIYKEIVRKYVLAEEEGPGMEDVPAGLHSRLERLRGLREVFTSPEQTVPSESLYYKRHIAFGIPSVIGTYHEPKFDAFGESLRVEEQIRVRLEGLVALVDGRAGGYTPDDLRGWVQSLEHVNGLLSLHSMGNAKADEIIAVLKSNRLRISQVIDLLRIWQNELTWAVESFYRTFKGPLARVLEHYPAAELPEYLKGLDESGGDVLGRATDVVIRDMLSGIAGFEDLDRLLNSIIRALDARLGSGDDEEFSMTDAPVGITKGHFAIDGLSPEEASRLAPAIGTKARNLAVLEKSGLPVPHGVVLPSRTMPELREHLKSEGFDVELREAVRALEDRTGFVFGGSRDPLFLSVRSGSYISMPGILTSILYCGFNRTTHEAMKEQTGNPWVAFDSYRRFVEHYAEFVLGVGADGLEEARRAVLGRYGEDAVRGLGSREMEELVRGYLKLLSSRGLAVPEDVHEQLRESVKAVYMSWHGANAERFREALRVSGRWGTAVLLMRMVYGNDRDSGAAVFFTRRPFSFQKGIYGETRESATGDDLVYGKFLNRPIARWQAVDTPSLEEADPGLFRRCEELAGRVEDVMGGLPQEVEAAYVRGGKVYVLQTKRMEFAGGPERTFDGSCRMESRITGRGVGVHGGALSGAAALSGSPEELKELRRRTGMPIILLKRETSTDDVHLMPEIDGIVTAIGGAASHAAILSQKFNVTAVVGCPDMKIEADEKGVLYARIGDFTVREGTGLSIDGSNGLVYSGICGIKETRRL